MDNITMSLGIYFEVKDAEIYGGEGTVGYAATIVDISLSGLQKADFTKYAESQKEGMAQFYSFYASLASSFWNSSPEVFHPNISLG